MICLDLESIRDLWKMNTDRELDHDNGSQTRHSCGSRCHLSTLTILSDVTKQGILQVSLYFKRDFNETWHNKQILGGTLLFRASDLVFGANKSCFFSCQTEEQRATQRSRQWLHLPACSHLHQSEQKCLVNSRYAYWVLSYCQHWSIWKCYLWVIYLEAAIFVCIF